MILIGPHSTVEAYQAYLGPGLPGGLATGLAISYLGGENSRQVRWKRALLTGGVFALLYGIFLGPIAGLICGQLAGLLMWLGIVRYWGGQIQLIEAPSWSWRLLGRRLKRWAPLFLSLLVLKSFATAAIILPLSWQEAHCLWP
jgi:hypothetical protein